MTDFGRVVWRGNRASERVQAGAVRALKLASEFVLEEANRTVPHEEGTLGRSGGTDIDERALEASVYYDTKYAVRQHEETHYRHNAGRRAKWLELTVREQTERVKRFMKTEIGREL